VDSGQSPETSTSGAAKPGGTAREPEAPTLTPAQRKFIAAIRKAGEFDADDTEGDLIQSGKDFCGSDNPDNLYTDYGGNPPNVEGIASNKEQLGALEKNAVRFLCPKYIKTWKQAMGGFDDGEHEVGGKKGIKPGRYRTLDKGLKGCYWERVSKGGQTIANNFVTYSPGHIEVTILPSDGGFSSNEKCYFWVPADLD
jgi:hypothetical protein